MSSSKQVVLIVGASRGIGRGLVSEFHSRGFQVIATVRSSSKTIEFPEGVQVLKFDLSNENEIKEAAKQVTKVDLLIISAGIGDKDKTLETSSERLAEYFDINVNGPFRVFQAFLPSLRASSSRKVAFVTSCHGSMEWETKSQSGFTGAYPITKAGLNMLAIQLHNALHKSENFTIVPIHPGWVKTEMGYLGANDNFPEPLLTVEECAKGMTDVLSNLKPEQSATFLSFDGSDTPW